MQVRQLILMALAGAAVAQNHRGMGMKGNMTEMGKERIECAEIQHATRLMNLVNNSTKLAEFQTKHHLNQSQIDDLKAKASAEENKYKTLTSNSTLVNECAAMRAERRMKMECKEMKRLQKLVNFANNQTAIQEFQTKHNLTAEEMERITERAKNATVKLNKLKSNATLSTACQAMKDGKGSTAQGAISEASRSAAGRTLTTASTFQVVCSSIFAAVLAALLAGLQI